MLNKIQNFLIRKIVYCLKTALLTGAVFSYEFIYLHISFTAILS